MCSWFFFFKQKTAYEMLRSLVGSEMCIRDRRHAHHQRLQRVPRQGRIERGHLDRQGDSTGGHRRRLLALDGGSPAVLQDQGPSSTERHATDSSRERAFTGDIVLDSGGGFFGGVDPSLAGTLGGLPAVSYTHLTLPTKRIV